MPGILESLENAQQDADDFALIVNGAVDENGDGYVTTRLGAEVPTLQRRMADLEINALTGRAADYGFTTVAPSLAFVAESLELDFAGGYYRDASEELEYDVLTASLPLAGWNFDRASAAWDTPEGGVVTQFAADVPRITNRGLRIERATATSGLYATNFANWTVTNLTITAEEVDPSGQAAKKIAVTAAGGAGLRGGSSGVGLATGNSAWAIVKKGSGPTQGNEFGLVNQTTATALMIVALNYDTGEITYSTGSSGARATDLGAGWWLMELSVTAGVANGDSLYFYAGFLGDAQGAGEYFYMSHAQIENSPFPTSRVVTNTGASENRSADALSISVALPSSFTIMSEVTLGAHKLKEMLFSVDDGSANNRLSVYRSATGMVVLEVVRNGSAATRDIVSKPSARTMKVALLSLGREALLVVDGGDPVSLEVGRPESLSRLWFGQDTVGHQLNGWVRKLVLLRREASVSELRDLTFNPDLLPLEDAPTTGHSLQSRFNPNTASTPNGVYGRQTVRAYGNLPTGLLIAENYGPSAVAIGKDGKVLWRDVSFRGRCVDVDPQTGLCLITVGETYRKIAWVDAYGYHVHTWALPGGVTGDIYGFRTNGDVLVINTIDGADGETWFFDLDANGYPIDTGDAFAAFTGNLKQARGMRIDTANNLLWIASIEDPINPQGCQGAVRSYNIGTGALVDSYYSHYPNDVDISPTGEIIVADEHIDRISAWNVGTDTRRTVMAGIEVTAVYEPGVSSISANVLARTVAGSNLAASAVEYGGKLYSPNGVSVLTNDIYAVADTDNSRILIASEGDDWVPDVTGVVGLLNEPGKVRPLLW